MVYKALANGVLVIHLGFILFVLFGGLICFWRRRIIVLHIPAVIWGALIEFSGWICPLTPLENEFLIKAGEGGYSDGFIEKYLISLIYIDGLTRELQIVFGSIVLVLNVIIYGWIFKNWRKGKKALKSAKN